MAWFNTHLAAWFAAPILAFASLFGFHGAIGGGTYATSTQPVACTADAMQCPDGSWVGRSGPNCQFVCSSTSTSTPAYSVKPVPPTKPIPPVSGTFRITSINPTSGAVGTSVTLTGSGFTQNDIVLFSGGPVTPSSITSTSIVFAVPNSVGAYCKPHEACPMYMRLITPGTYSVSVIDSTNDKTTNSVSFKVTGDSVGPPSSGGDQRISIGGIDAPSSLSLGQIGTWSVHASVPSDGGQLHYSVNWGDEVASSAAQIRDPGTQQVQSSATFTHAYQLSGTYTATFTVTNDQGASASVSSTITVTPLY